MLKIPKMAVLVAAMALSGLFAASAGAAEWHTNGHKAFATTNSGAIRLAIHNAGGTVLVECASSTGTGTLRGPTVGTSIALGIITVTPDIGACTVSGAAGYRGHCSPGEFNAVTYTGGTTFATAGTGVTSGTIQGFDCTIGFGATNCSTITGSINAHYINPHVLGSATGFGRLTLTAGGSNLTVSKIGAGCAAVPHGTATLGSPGAGSTVGDLTWVADGPNAPWMFRTP